MDYCLDVDDVLFIIIWLNWFCDYSYCSVAVVAAVIDSGYSSPVYDVDNNNRYTLVLVLTVVVVVVVLKEEAIIK